MAKKKMSGDIISYHQYEQNVELDKQLGDFSWNARNWSDLDGQEDYLLVNYLQSGKLLGLMLLKVYPLEKMYHLLKMVVEKNKRSCGIGSFLFHGLKRYMKECEASDLYLEVEADNFGAINFYEKQGIKKICLTKNYYSNGKSAWKMTTKFPD